MELQEERVWGTVKERIYCFPKQAKVEGGIKYKVEVEGAFGRGDEFVIFIGCGSKLKEIYKRV